MTRMSFRSTDKSTEEIREIQRLLGNASKIYRNIPASETDGIYSSVTRAALVVFQQCTGLSVTGEADPATMRKLRHTAAAACEYFAPPEGIQPFFPNSCRLTVGSSGAAVKMLQIMLETLAEKYDNIRLPENSGIYGPRTARAAADILRPWGAAPDGITDIFTWNLIVGMFNAAVRE